MSNRAIILWSLALAPLAAYASFGGGGPCQDFGCYFLLWGVILAVSGGVPVCVLAFIVLHLRLCNPARSKYRQAAVGGVMGLVGYELAAAGASLASLHDQNPWVALLSICAVLAIASALYARSSPRERALA